MEPRYSIIVPVYNVAPYLSECLDSVLRQRVVEWECLCVDDGSTDGSAEILDAYQRRDNRFRILHKSNGGVSSARNAALDMCRGEWIVYLDGDDILTDDALAVFQRCLKVCPDAEILQYDIRGMAEVVRGCPFKQDIEAIEPVIWRDRSEIVSGLGGASFVTNAYNRVKCGDVRFKSYIMGEDRLYMATCLARCAVKVRIYAIGYGCRRRKGSAMRSAWSLQKYHDALCVRLETIEVVRASGVDISPVVKRMVVRSVLEPTAFDVERLDSPSDRKLAWKQWFDAVRSLPADVLENAWQRFVVGLLRTFPVPLLAKALCVFPHRLKLKLKGKNRK